MPKRCLVRVVKLPFFIHNLQGKEDSQWSQGLVSAAQLVASVIGSLCEAANTVIQVRGKHKDRKKDLIYVFLCL